MTDETKVAEDDEALGAIEKLRASHVELMSDVEALDTGPKMGSHPNAMYTRFHFYRAGLTDALADLDAITDEINEEGEPAAHTTFSLHEMGLK